MSLTKKASKMPAGSPPNAPTHAAAQSRVSNGATLFLQDASGRVVDGRTRLSRRFRDVYFQIIADLGGDDLLSENERQLARRAAGLSVWGEWQETLLAAESSKFNLEQYSATVNGLTRVVRLLGLKRRQRPVQALDEYLASREIEVDAEAREVVS